MAYLDNSEIIVDAILTKKGREKLAAGQSLNITQFALGDDEIDYQLYDAAHPKGSAYYDAAIKAIPILEASPDETQVLKYKLVTLPKGTTKIPQVSISMTAITTNQQRGKVTITPTTSPAGNTTSGYTAVLADKTAGTLVGIGVAAAGQISVSDSIAATADVKRGATFEFIPNPALTATVVTTLTVYGNETGGSVSIPVTVNYVA
ncbi:hypothetical protein EB155_00730 [archaeon]|jgi:hypothetical protein|nr:hypothetical protein [archaeon]NDB54794.1 hypothetical protein [archaeon]NDB78369.1 hypothetical protein [archaeon]